MKILLLVDCALHEASSAAQMMYDIAMEFALNGNQIIFLSTSAGSSKKIKINTISPSLINVQVKIKPTKTVGRFKRAINEILLSQTVWSNAKDFLKNNHCHYVIYYSPTIFFGRLVLRLKKLWGAKTYLILRDIFPQWAADLGFFSSKSLIYKYFHHKEKTNYRAADLIGVQSKANLNYFKNKQWTKNYKIRVLHNWISLDNLKSIQEKKNMYSFREKFGLQGKVVLVYGGNIGVAQDIDNILRLANRCKAMSEIYFLLVGSGTEKERIVAEIYKQRLKNIALIPSLEQYEYFSMLSEFDIGLISLSRKLTTHNFPGKMLGYMYAGMPILASINPGNDLSDLISNAKAGIVCENGNDDAFYNGVIRLARNISLKTEMGRNARKLLNEKFSSKAAAKEILSALL